MPEVFRQAGETTQLGSDWLERLKAAASESPLRRSRVCMHTGDDDAIHEMIIVLCGDLVFPPHRHRDKAESFHIIEGELDLLIFNDDGTLLRNTTLGPPGSGKSFYHRLNAPLYHAVVPRSRFVVFHETTSGPFRRDEAEVAPWSPTDPEELHGFIQRLLQFNV